MSTTTVARHPILLSFRLPGSEPVHLTALGAIVTTEGGPGRLASSEVAVEITRNDLGTWIAALESLRTPAEPPDLIDRLRALAEAGEASDDAAVEAFGRQLRAVVGFPGQKG